MPTFIGLDLAWSPRKESGLCYLVGDSSGNLECSRLEARVCDMETLAAEIDQIEGPVVAAIDAPVLCTDERWVDPEIGHLFGRYKFSAYPASAAKAKGYTAGMDLGEALKHRGFTLDPQALLNGSRAGRTALEVYPHTIHVRLFRLTERLKYKKGRVAKKRAGLLQYQWHLEKLIQDVAPRLLESHQVQCALLPAMAVEARGKSLKRLDDSLDGLTCALAAWLIWKEPKSWEMIGDLNGYIVAPRDPAVGRPARHLTKSAPRRRGPALPL